MKDMLVDMHSPAYHHLLARANYNMDAHFYLEFTQYLQNLGLLEESFNKRNAQHSKEGSSKPKAHKAHKHQMVRINAGSIQTMIIHGLTVLITQRVRLIGETRMPPITTKP
jgi:hypothetical protein